MHHFTYFKASSTVYVSKSKAFLCISGAGGRGGGEPIALGESRKQYQLVTPTTAVLHIILGQTGLQNRSCEKPDRYFENTGEPSYPWASTKTAFCLSRTMFPFLQHLEKWWVVTDELMVTRFHRWQQAWGATIAGSKILPLTREETITRCLCFFSVFKTGISALSLFWKISFLRAHKCYLSLKNIPGSIYIRNTEISFCAAELNSDVSSIVKWNYLFPDLFFSTMKCMFSQTSNIFDEVIILMRNCGREKQ